MDRPSRTNRRANYYETAQARYELLHQETPPDFQEKVASLPPVLDGVYDKIKGCRGVAPGLLWDMKFFLETEGEEQRKETGLNCYAERARIVDAEIFKAATKSTSVNLLANVAKAYLETYSGPADAGYIEERLSYLRINLNERFKSLRGKGKANPFELKKEMREKLRGILEDLNA